MSESTPGPWEWVKDTWHGGHAGLCGPDGAEVLWPTSANDGDHGAAWFDEQTTKDADMALIAAAPRLLAACKAVEWGGTVQGYANAWPCCPSCFGLEPFDGVEAAKDDFSRAVVVGHFTSCQLAAAIKAAKGEG